MSLLQSELNTVLYVNNDPYSYVALVEGITGALTFTSTNGTGTYYDTYMNIDTLNQRLNLGSGVVDTSIAGTLVVDNLASTSSTVQLFQDTQNIYLGSTGSVYIGSGTGSNIYFGSTGSNIHFNGFLAEVSTNNLTVSDPVITINKGQLDSAGAGIEIDENGTIVGSIKVMDDKTGYTFVTPSGVNSVLLTDNRVDWYDSVNDTSNASIRKTVDNYNFVFTTSTGAYVNLVPANNDADIVLTEGDQTLNGLKTFTNAIVSNSTGYFTGVIVSQSGSFGGLNVAHKLTVDEITVNTLNITGSISFSDLLLPGYLTVEGTGTFNGPLDVNGTGTFNGHVAFNGADISVEIANSLTVGTTIVVSETGYFTGLETSQSGSFGGLYCASTGTFNGTLLANCNTGTSLYIASVSNTLSLDDGALVAVGGAAIGKDLRVGGTAYKPTSQFWTVSSDKRIKTDIVPLTDDETINSIKSINIKKYKLSDAYRQKYSLTDKQYIGVIADEFMVSHPDGVKIVTENLDGNEIKDFKTVDMSSQLFELISCCQNLLKRVESLESKL